MIFPQPKSFLKLLLIGFSFVVLPLLVAIAYGALYMGKLANQSQLAVYQAAKATQTSRILLEQVTRLERAARQYEVLGDQTLFKAYKETHDDIEKTAKGLSVFPLDDSMLRQLNQLVHLENSIFTALQKYPHNSSQAEQAVEKFKQISDLARKVLAGSNRVVDQEVQELHDLASKAQNRFVWVGLALIPVVIVLVIIFSVILARPVRQIDSAIRILGSGEFTQPVYVSGPQDLEYLGQRLDWLRMRLAEVEEEKAKFVRHVSHELKTPLTAIREGADLLDDGIVGNLNRQQKQVVEILVSNTQKLQQLIQDLLSFSGAHLKQTKINNESVNLDKLVYKVITDQKLAIMAKKLKLQTKLDPVAINGDKEMLRLIIDNLLSNAVKYSPMQGRLAVTVTRNGMHAKVDVIDDGPGIKDEEKEKVFDAFFQGEVKASGHIKGTGLGLSIAKEFVEAHGGRIVVKDNLPNGAHISFVLPIDAVPVQEVPIVDEDRLHVF